MKLNYSFLFVIPLALILFMDNMYIELAMPDNPVGQELLLNTLVKGSAVLSIVYCLIYFQRMSTYMRFAFFMLLLYVAGLVFESKYVYGSFMVYPHVFVKVLIFSYSFFVYTFYKANYYIKTSHVVWFILIGFWLNVLLIKPHTLSISAFTNHERGVYSTSVYMLVVPFLYFMSNYFYKGKFMSLFWSFFVLFAIFFFQHRTVWISTAFVLVIYYFFIRLKTDKPINFVAKLLPVGTLVGILGVIASGFVLSIHPEIIEKVQENFSDIENYDKQGTGGWRYIQIMSYLPFIQDNFFFGMRFDGFELPIQFWRDDIDAPVFEDGHGHHFHSFYLEIFFYTGLVGFGLYLLIALYPIVQAFKKRVLTINQIMLVAFICSSFIFSISYVLPVFFYGILGWTIAAIEVEHVPYVSFIKNSGLRMKARRLFPQRTLPSTVEATTSSY
ncbi:O-antigen ligase family protein [Pontibacter sp. BT310]|uniref:O-antigen ligase family protein n=1 Tax=Pontibacter populi TaxID=890055 RepID=A0ABS6XDC4_9BACT|nr:MULTISPECIES: O-antigen ligase family protein [Pontibacter]MBJ6119124.1 O-antigen ligase family protein [Pontibacter sp. BT310]MBR0571552.1 O-antigen ligase family protein [Microvirga sp. STS03]MBW3365978.1 O-antigen ligase family protein [Pontibacter populi]